MFWAEAEEMQDRVMCYWRNRHATRIVTGQLERWGAGGGVTESCVSSELALVQEGVCGSFVTHI